MYNIAVGSIKNVFGVFDGETVEKYDATEMQDFFSQYFLNDARKDTCIMWINKLSLYAEDILYVLHHIGFADVTMEAPKVSAMRSQSYQYLISDDATAYRIIVKVGHKTTYIYNSDNLLSNLSDEEIIKDFGYNIKGSRIEKLTKGIWKAAFLLSGFQVKKTPFTLSMYASRDWRKTEGLYFCENLVNMRNIFIGDNHTRLSEWLRKSYHGGWCYLNPKGDFDKAREKGGLVYDVNSLYPYIMATKPMPWGAPEYYKGKIPEKIISDKYLYYFIHIKCKFELKKDGRHLPFITKKDSMWYWGRDYLETSDIVTRSGERVKSVISAEGKRVQVECDLILSKTDYEMMLRHYDVYDITYIEGVVFKTCRHVFDSFIGKHYKVKQTATASGNKSERRISKMIMNGVSGTLAKRAERTNIIINYDENDDIKYGIRNTTLDTPSYIHIASALLSYAREYVIETACLYKDRFLYSDTDSLHLAGKETPDLIKRDPEKLGFWKLETVFDDAVYIKRKTYVLKKSDGNFKLVFAGVDKKARAIIEDELKKADFNNDIFANVIDGKTYKSDLKEDYKDADIFNPQSPDYISYKTFVKDLILKDDTSDEYDPMYMLRYATYPTFFEWSEDFVLHEGIKWNRIKL